MTDGTSWLSWTAAATAALAYFGVHPAMVVAAGVGAGVGLVFDQGLTRGAALSLSALMTLAAPLLAAWAQAMTWVGAGVTAGAGMSLVLAALAPTLLRGIIEHAPELMRAGVKRAVKMLGGGK